MLQTVAVGRLASEALRLPGACWKQLSCLYCSGKHWMLCGTPRHDCLDGTQAIHDLASHYWRGIHPHHVLSGYPATLTRLRGVGSNLSHEAAQGRQARGGPLVAMHASGRLQAVYGEGVRVVLRHECCWATPVGCNDWEAHRHCFHMRAAPPLSPGRQYKNISGFVEAPEFVIREVARHHIHCRQQPARIGLPQQPKRIRGPGVHLVSEVVAAVEGVSEDGEGDGAAPLPAGVPGELPQVSLQQQTPPLALLPLEDREKVEGGLLGRPGLPEYQATERQGQRDHRRGIEEPHVHRLRNHHHPGGHPRFPEYALVELCWHPDLVHQVAAAHPFQVQIVCLEHCPAHSVGGGRSVRGGAGRCVPQGLREAPRCGHAVAHHHRRLRRLLAVVHQAHDGRHGRQVHPQQTAIADPVAMLYYVQPAR
mmetsp:Transcript_14362/g.43371  ORF Transcript_14362/g.43371 Transcript_14362/m.43371 type:complete len:422 (-) Transcript_14362:657-1922(-)